MKYLIYLFGQDPTGSDPSICQSPGKKEMTHSICAAERIIYKGLAGSRRFSKGWCSTQGLTTDGRHYYPGSQESRGKVRKSSRWGSLDKNRALVEGHDQPGRRSLDYKHSAPPLPNQPHISCWFLPIAESNQSQNADNPIDAFQLGQLPRMRKWIWKR